ncbi:MAG: FAD-dependent oxidoreductase [Thermaerobacterales bacterium]
MTGATEEYDAVVIGAGFLGNFIAFNLSKKGVKTCVIEKQYPAAGTSGTTPAWVGYGNRRPVHYALFAKESSRLYEQIQDEYGIDYEYSRPGALAIVWTQDAYEQRKAVVADQQAHGIDVQLLTAEQVAEMEPVISPDNIAGALYSPGDAHIMPFKVVHITGYLARELGATYKFYTEVTKLEQHDGRYTVHTNQGVVIRAGKVCLAAGVWSPAVSETLGIDLPIHPSRGQLVVSDDLPATVAKIVGGGSLHQWKQPGPILMGSVTNEDGISENVNTYDGLQGVLRGLVKLAPTMKDAPVVRAFSGIRPMPADGLPLLGEVPGYPGFFVAVTHSGATLGPAIGQVTAELMCGEEPFYDITPYHVSRVFEEGSK